MSSDLKTSFDLEPNPFERSFATKDDEGRKGNEGAEQRSSYKEEEQANVGKQKSETNKHNLHIPNISTLDQNINRPPTGASPSFTSGDRKLPPLGMSPGGQINGGMATPGSNLWNSLLNATNNPNNGTNAAQNGESNDGSSHNVSTGTGTNQNYTTGQNNGVPNQEGSFHPGNSNNANMNQFISMLRKSGLTPNESNLRSGLTPGGVNHHGGHMFAFNNQLPGLTTPGAFLNSPITPGLSNLLGMSANQNASHPTQGTIPPPPNSNAGTHDYQNINSFDNGIHQREQQHVQHQQQQHQQEQQQQEQQHQQQQEQQQQEQQQQEQQQQQQQQQQQTPQQGYATNADDKEPDEKSGSKRKLKNNSEKSKKQKTDSTAKSKKPKKEDSKDIDSNDSTVSPDSTAGNNKNNGDSKRKSFLERNRVAASKCRQRKKQLIQKMEDELSFYSTGYRELSAQVTQLRDQVINLRGILIGHKDCPMLVSSVGGFEQLNNIISQSNYITQIASKSQTNASSMPSTIPTTLNTHTGAMNTNQAVNPYILPQNGQQSNSIGHSPALPMHVTQANADRSSNNSTTNPSTDTLNTSASISYPNNQQTNSIASHHSLSDLPSAVAQNLNQPNNQLHNTGDLRTIHSMSNIVGMNNSDKLQNLGNSNFNLRPVNSMMDLNQQHIQQQPPTQQHNYGNNMVDPVTAVTRNMLGLSQTQS